MGCHGPLDNAADIIALNKLDVSKNKTLFGLVLQRLHSLKNRAHHYISHVRFYVVKCAMINIP
jgi:hypothetical protein